VLSVPSPDKLTLGSRSVAPYLAFPFYSRLAPLWAASNIAWAVVLAAAVASLVGRYRRGGMPSGGSCCGWCWPGWPSWRMWVWWGIFRTGPVLALLVVVLIPAAVTVAIL